MTSTSTGTYNFDLDVVVEPGTTYAMRAGTGGVQVDMVLYIYETAI